MEEMTKEQFAEKAGFDLNLIERNLQLTPEQRIEEHQSALDLVWQLEEARLTLNEKS
ncbi:hypothetical protein GW915_01805 [bacterium]|nr:hypothetical protein [bacterium]